MPRVTFCAWGQVGMLPTDGCSVLLRTADRSGNACIKGGAQVDVSCADSKVDASCTDNGDGTYQLTWRSKFSTKGEVDAKVSVNGSQVIGSPMKVRLLSTRPERSKTEAASLGSGSSTKHTPLEKRIAQVLRAEGDAQAFPEDGGAPFHGVGLRTAVAGEPTSLLLRFKDEHGNPAMPSAPGSSYAMGLSISKKEETKHDSKLKVQDLEPIADVESVWGEEDTGLHRLTYVAKHAGLMQMNLWCEMEAGNRATRELLPGSPFVLHVTAGEPTAQESYIADVRRGHRLDDFNDRRTRGGEATRASRRAP